MGPLVVSAGVSSGRTEGGSAATGHAVNSVEFDEARAASHEPPAAADTVCFAFTDMLDCLDIISAIWIELHP